MRLRRLVFVLPLLGLIPTALAQNATTTSLAITAGGSPVTTVRQGTVVTLTATISTTGGAAVAPPGQVEFCDVGQQPQKCTDIRLLATVQLSGTGTATYKFFPGSGAHTYQAIFLGTRTQAASSSLSTVLAVTPYYPTTTALSATSNANGYTLTATVTTSGGTVPPTGTVTFEDTSNNNFVLGTVPLVPGTSTGPTGLSFATSQDLPTTQACLSAAVADVNGDGKPDIILGLLGFDSYGPPPGDTGDPLAGYTNTVVVFLGNGDGTFTRMPSIPLLLGVTSIGVADLNGDGKPDLVAFETLGAFGYTQPPPPDNLNEHPLNTVQVLLGKGDGTFSIGQAILNPNSTQAYPVLPPSASGLPFAAPTIGIGDFNGDGIPDIAFATGGGGTIVLYFGNGDGTFKAGPITQAGINPTGIAVGDFNGDGIPDLAITEPVTGGNPSVLILLGKGDGTFTAATPLTGVSSESSAIVTGDFNGDGLLDLAIQSAGSPAEVNVFLGDGRGNFTQAPQSPIAGFAPNGSVLAVGDFNGDGVPDLITGSSANPDNLAYPNLNTLALLLGNGNGTFQSAISVVAAGQTAFAISSVALGDFIGSGSSAIASADNAGYDAWVLLPQSTPQTATATLNIPSIIGSGQHSIIAIYSGDTNYQPSASPPVLLAAEPIQTTVTLTVSPTTTNYGQPVFMTATLTPSSAQGDNATGTIAFGYSSTAIPLGTVPIVNGVATFTSTLLPIGTDTVTAIYPGDANFSTSGGYTTEIVTGFTSVSVLTSTPNPSYIGQPITITAAVTGIGSTVVPAGSVTFYDNATIIGRGTLDANGHATMTTSTLALGIHTLSFQYPANLGYNASTSPPVTQVVNAEGSTTTLTAGPNPAGIGQPVTLTAGVTLSGPGTAAGSITFYDGATALIQTTLDPTGHATFTTSTLAAGTHNLTAAFAGAAGYGGSTSPIVSEIIETIGFTLSLSSPSITLQTHQHTTTSVTLTSLGNFADSITIACANPPTDVSCTFTPAPTSLTGNATATVSFYLDTGGSNINGPIRGSLTPPHSSTYLALLLSPFIFFVTRRRRMPRLLLVAILTLPAALLLTACGANIIIPIPAATPGTFTVPITATAATSGLAQTANLTLTITP